jgi:hypothetical protein
MIEVGAVNSYQCMTHKDIFFKLLAQLVITHSVGWRLNDCFLEKGRAHDYPEQPINGRAKMSAKS